jgi:hypothetical protein
MVRSIREVLLWLSAADRKVLERCPGEQTRFVAAGGAVLTTTAMAMLAGCFTAHTLLHVNELGSLLFGAGWALAIMNIERYVQSSIRRQRAWWLTLLMATPRLALAFLLGLVISDPLLLKVFQAEVNTQVEVDKNAQLASARSALNHQFAVVPTLQARQSTLEQELNTPETVGVALQHSPEYHSLAQRYGLLSAEAHDAPNPQTARSAEHAAHVALEQLVPLHRQLLAQEEADNATQRAEEHQQLQATQRELQPLESELNGKSRVLKERFHTHSGLADQMRALSVLVHSNAQVDFIKNVLMLFILAIDSLPALLKTLLCLGRSSVYEEAQNAIDGATTTTIQTEESLRCSEAQRAAQEHQQTQAEIGQARVAKRIEVQKDLDDLSTQILQETIRPHVERWAQRMARHYARRLATNIDRQSPPARERPGQAHPDRSARRLGRFHFGHR